MTQNRIIPLKTSAHAVSFVFWSEETARVVETCYFKIQRYLVSFLSRSFLFRLYYFTYLATFKFHLYVCKYFDILIFFCFFYVQKFVTGLTVRDNDQIYEVLG